MKTEIHPIKNGYLNNNTKCLIMGTFPPFTEHNNNENFFFYSSAKNHFWNIIEEIFPNTSLKKTKHKLKHICFKQNVKHKKVFCEKHKIGFLDVFSSIKRRKEGSSKDLDIIPHETICDNDILNDTLEVYKGINTICCTYKLAFDTLICKLSTNNLIFKKNELTQNGEEVIYKLDSREIKIVLLYPATRSNHKKSIKMQQYKKLIFE